MVQPETQTILGVSNTYASMPSSPPPLKEAIIGHFYSKHTNRKTGEVDYKGLKADLYQVDPASAREAEEHQLKMQEGQTRLEKMQNELKPDLQKLYETEQRHRVGKNKLISAVLGQSTDQIDYAKRLNYLNKLGFNKVQSPFDDNEMEIPQIFDRGFIDNINNANKQFEDVKLQEEELKQQGATKLETQKNTGEAVNEAMKIKEQSEADMKKLEREKQWDLIIAKQKAATTGSKEGGGGSKLGMAEDLAPTIEYLQNDSKWMSQIADLAFGRKSFNQWNKDLLSGGGMGATKFKLPAIKMASDYIAKQLNPDYDPLAQQMNMDILKSAAGRQLNTQRQAVAKLIYTLDKSYNTETGEYEKIPNWLYSDLSLDFIRAINPSAQAGIEMLREVKQRSVHGDVIGATNYLFGLQKTTPPKEALDLLHKRAIDLQDIMKQQYDNLVTGVTRTSEPPKNVGNVDVRGEIKKGPPIGTIKNGYRFKGGDPNNKDSWEKTK